MLDSAQLKCLSAAFERGAVDASEALAQWLQVPSLMMIESLEQRPACEAIDAFSTEDEVVCFCSMTLAGVLSGHLVLSFDDSSGLSLSDLLLGRPTGTSTEWGEVEKSAALESHNIVGCTYLNTLAALISDAAGTEMELVPSPPFFRRDFAAALLQALFLDQTRRSETIFLASARFEIRDEPLNWTLMFIPDGDSMQFLQERLPREST